jgi:NADPH:quinone reductase-like Zn-dependent oxidoreductase
VEYGGVNPIDAAFTHLKRVEGFKMGSEGSGVISKLGLGVN